LTKLCIIFLLLGTRSCESMTKCIPLKGKKILWQRQATNTPQIICLLSAKSYIINILGQNIIKNAFLLSIKVPTERHEKKVSTLTIQYVIEMHSENLNCDRTHQNKLRFYLPFKILII
jgi:hypothetical protein